MVKNIKWIARATGKGLNPRLWGFSQMADSQLRMVGSQLEVQVGIFWMVAAFLKPAITWKNLSGVGSHLSSVGSHLSGAGRHLSLPWWQVADDLLNLSGAGLNLSSAGLKVAGDLLKMAGVGLKMAGVGLKMAEDLLRMASVGLRMAGALLRMPDAGF